MLAPSWERIAIGPLLRGGIDLRSYCFQLVLAGIFQSDPDDIKGLSRALLSTFASQLPEPTRPDAPVAENPKSGVVVFREIRDGFRLLNGWNEFILDSLREITVPRFLAVANDLAEIPLALNIRCANDLRSSADEASVFEYGHKIPVRWYSRCLDLIREAAGYSVPAYIVSDGSEAQLEQLLSRDNVRWVRPGCAISDLLILSKAKVLIGSGSSSFAAWAAFLGQMPAASPKGHPFVDWRIERRLGQFLGELDLREPAPQFLAQVRAALTESYKPLSRCIG